MPGLDLGAHLRQVRLRLVVPAAVVPERAHRRDDHDDVRLETADAADDVHELLHAEVGGEARLGDEVLAELEADAVGDDRVVAVRDVRERARVHEAELALERLDDVRLDRLLEEDGHRRRPPATSSAVTGSPSAV